MASTNFGDDPFDDDVFDDIDEEELARLEQPWKFEDDVFDDIDEAELAALERPIKRQKNSDSQETPATPHLEHLSLAEEILKSKFGYKLFRHEQAGAIQSVLAGDNTLVIFPTGAGKSLCYQIPAIAFPELDKSTGSRSPQNAGVTIVVSPLIALMKDQVDALKKRGIPADSFDSSKTWEELQIINQRLRNSELRLLYCAPEKLNNEAFINNMKQAPGGIRLVAVDEAHCVSEWGHSFRPDYLKVARFVDEIRAERVICLTATATPKVADDICKAFNIKALRVFRTSPYRPNLHLDATTIDVSTGSITNQILSFAKGSDYDPSQIQDETTQRFEDLFRFLKIHPGPTLVYVALQQQAEINAGVLIKRGFKAAAFHAGMKPEIKRQIQEDFMASKIEIICATIAFGMGIDKPDIRNVVHWDLANSVEEYSQQIGRASRDGEPSTCMFYLTPSAFYLRELFARGDLPSPGSLRHLLIDIFNRGRGLSVGEVFNVSEYAQGREFDIRPSPLAVIYALLELRFGLFRSITPEYSIYKFEERPTYYPTLSRDQSTAAQTILKNATKKYKWTYIDVSAAAKATNGVSRQDLVNKLDFLNNHGHIKLQTSGVEHRYVISKILPQTDKEIDAIFDPLYSDLKNSEKDAIKRQQEVMALLTGRKCFALSLAEHFGMGLPGGRLRCNHCRFCKHGQPARLPYRGVVPTDRQSIQPVLNAIKIRDDPRFLARFAFGVRSPRITYLKLDQHKEFRSLSFHDFDALLTEFENACAVKGK